MKLLSVYRGLGRPVYVIAAATVVNRFGDFVMPFLALFLTSRLGYSESATGLTVMLVGSGAFLGAWLGGRAADRWGRRRVLLACYALSGLLLGPTGWMVSGSIPAPAFIPLLMINSVVRGGVRPALRSILADLSSVDRRKDAFSLNYLGINVGVALGPLVAGYLFEHSLPWIFWGDAVSSFLASLLILLFVPDTVPQGSSALAPDEAFESEKPLRAFFRRPLLLLFTLGMFFQGFVYSQFGFSLPLHINQLFADGALKFSRVMSLNAVLVLALTPLYTRLTREKHALLVSSGASLLYVIGFGMLAFEPAYGWFLFSTLIWTSGEILSVIHQMGYFSLLTPGNYRGQFNAYSNIITSSGHIISPYFGGLIIAAFGARGMWFTVAALSLLSALGFYLLYRNEDRLRYKAVVKLTEAIPSE